MATLTITNETSGILFLRDFYATLQASGDAAGRDVLEVQRPLSSIPAMAGLQQMVADGDVTLEVELSADETASGLASPPNSISADDFAPVASTAVAAPIQTFRKAFTATGATGTKVDVTLFAANALPYKFRILDAVCLVSDNEGGTTAELRDEAAGAGTALVVFATAAAGPNRPSTAFTASALVSQSSAAKGLFLNYDRATAGEVIVTVRRES